MLVVLGWILLFGFACLVTWFCCLWVASEMGPCIALLLTALSSYLSVACFLIAVCLFLLGGFIVCGYCLFFILLFSLGCVVWLLNCFVFGLICCLCWCYLFYYFTCLLLVCCFGVVCWLFSTLLFYALDYGCVVGGMLFVVRCFEFCLYILI